MKMNCLVIDDEPFAQKGMEEYIKEVDFLELIAVCNNAAEAYAALHQHHVDLILLDIEMPGLSGIEFIQSIKTQPAVIFTTAYPQYAVQGFELDVIDYLVKPILFQRFVKAVTKAKYFFDNKTGNSLSGTQKDHFFLKVNYQLEKIFFKDVLFIEALQNYVAIHMEGRKIISYITMANMEQNLPSQRFMRIHKSYIVALDKIETISSTKVMVRSHELPVSRNIKDQLIHVIGDKLIKR